MDKKQKILNSVLIVLGMINLCVAWGAWNISESMPTNVGRINESQRRLTERVDAIMQWVQQVAPIQHTHMPPTNQPITEVTDGTQR